MNKDNKAYQDMMVRVGKVTDRLGHHVDFGIRHTVVAFNLRDLHTVASCIGHMDHGLPYPWIDLDAPEEKPILDSLLKEFNVDRPMTNNLYLKTCYFGAGLPGNRYRVMHYSDITNDGVKNQKLLVFLRKEMNAFADFLLKDL
jgi:hypothetical protein